MKKYIHIDYLRSKLSAGTFALRKVKVTPSPDILRTAVDALFETYIRYGISLCGRSSSRNLKRVLWFCKKNKIIRLIANLPPRERCRDAFKNIRILTVISICIIDVICYTLKQVLVRNESIHQHFTMQTSFPKISKTDLQKNEEKLFFKKPAYRLVTPLYHL